MDPDFLGTKLDKLNLAILANISNDVVPFGDLLALLREKHKITDSDLIKRITALLKSGWLDLYFPDEIENKEWDFDTLDQLPWPVLAFNINDDGRAAYESIAGEGTSCYEDEADYEEWLLLDAIGSGCKYLQDMVRWLSGKTGYPVSPYRVKGKLILLYDYGYTKAKFDQDPGGAVIASSCLFELPWPHIAFTLTKDGKQIWKGIKDPKLLAMPEYGTPLGMEPRGTFLTLLDRQNGTGTVFAATAEACAEKLDELASREVGLTILTESLEFNEASDYSPPGSESLGNGILLSFAFVPKN